MLIKAIWDETMFFVPSDEFVEENISNRVLYTRRQNPKERKISICSETAVNALRLEVLRGNLKPEELVFIYKGQEIKVDELGQLQDPPKGFCSLALGQHLEILELMYDKAEKGEK